MTYTPEDVPPDTSQYVYRYVTRLELDFGMGVPTVDSQLQQIWISQP
ncbi:MAG: hypothetical protein ACXVGR_12605 [Mycobacteriaceae bacterium]